MHDGANFVSWYGIDIVAVVTFMNVRDFALVFLFLLPV